MDIVDKTESEASRSRMIPVFEQPCHTVKAERQHLIWARRGSPRTIRGIKTNGGFYLHRPKASNLSFAVDESLEVGDAENARPVCLRPGQYIGYHLLDPDQRAAYVRWLARENIPAEAMRFCVRLHVAALEWFLFRDHVCPNLVIDELLRVIECTAESADAPLLRILAWTAFFQSRDVHIAVMEELVGSGCCLDGSMARLLLLDCADSNRRIWPELAFEIIALFGGIRDARGCEHFRERYISRFRILYPDGLGITAGRRRTQVEYNLYCYELRTETCRLVIQDALESVLPALREVAAPLIGEKRIDPQKPS